MRSIKSVLGTTRIKEYTSKVLEIFQKGRSNFDDSICGIIEHAIRWRGLKRINNRVTNGIKRLNNNVFNVNYSTADCKYGDWFLKGALGMIYRSHTMVFVPRMADTDVLIFNVVLLILCGNSCTITMCQ